MQIIIIRRENPQDQNPIPSWIIVKNCVRWMGRREKEIKRFGIYLVIGQSLGEDFTVAERPKPV